MQKELQGWIEQNQSESNVVSDQPVHKDVSNKFKRKCNKVQLSPEIETPGAIAFD